MAPDRVSDSHAEVLCRRAFRGYLHTQIRLCGSSGSCAVEWDAGTRRFRVTDGVRFHLYVSQGLCGDASTEHLLETRRVEDLAKREAAVDEDAGATDGKRKLRTGDGHGDDAKRARLSEDAPAVVRGRERLDLLGVRRTKPGRYITPLMPLTPPRPCG